MITLIFRYDDFSARSNTAVESEMFSLFSKYGVPCVVGAIPLVCAGDERDTGVQQYLELPIEKESILREGIAAQLVEVALHGYHHQNLNPNEGGRLREFSGLSTKEQVRRLQDGLTRLEQSGLGPITTFIPPFNAYDSMTVKAVETTGIKCLSAAMFDDVPDSTDLCFMPHTCSILQVKEALDRARVMDEHSIVMPLLHPFDFRESGDPQGRYTFPEFEELLSWIAVQSDVRLATCAAVVADGGCDTGRFVAQREYLRWSLKSWGLPSWSRRFPRTQYLTAAKARGLRRWMVAEAVGCYISTGVASAFVAYALLAVLPVPVAVVRWGMMCAVFAAALALYVRRNPVYFRGAICLVVLLGLTAGAWVAR